LFERALQKEYFPHSSAQTILEEKLGWLSSGINTLRTFGDRNWEASFSINCSVGYPAPGFWILSPCLSCGHPQLGIHDWSELAQFTPVQRELVIKVSGFSEKAWGSRRRLDR
jgi:hypothetical protein